MVKKDLNNIMLCFSKNKHLNFFLFSRPTGNGKNVNFSILRIKVQANKIAGDDW